MEEVISKLVSWDPQENTSLHGHTGPVWSVKATSDDNFLFSGGEDYSIIIWDLKSEQNIGVLTGHINTVNALELCLNETVLVSGAWDGSIRIWDWRSQIHTGDLQGHTAGVYVFAVTKDSRTLVSGSGDYTARIWNVETRVLLATLNNTPNSIFALALQPDEKVLVTGGWNGVIRLWDFTTFSQLSEHQSSNEVVQCMAITPNNNFLIFGTRGNKVKVWHWNTKTEHMCFELHNNWVRNLVVTLDSKYFISASADKTIRMVNIEEKTQEFNFDRNDGYIFGLCLGKNGKKLYSGASDKIVRIRNIGTIRNVKTMTGHTRCIMSVAFAKNGEFLVTGSEDSTVRKWSTQSFTEVFNTNFHNNNTVWAVFVMEDCERILSVGGDHKLIVMDSNGNLIKRLSGHSHPIFCVSGSLDNTKAVTGAQDKNVILWDLQELKSIKVLEGHTDTVFSVKFCEKDSKVVSGSADYTVRVWFTKPFGLMTVIRIQGGMIESVAISPDLKYLAVGDRKNKVHLWDWQELTHIETFSVHSKWVKCVNFSADSKTIISCSNDLTVIAWDVEDLCLDYTCNGHKSTIRSVAVSPDGKSIASVSEDCSIRVWPIEVEDYLSIIDFVGLYDDFLLKNSILTDQFPKKSCFFKFSKLKVNILHVYCYLGKSELLLKALEQGVKIKRDLNKNSPLYYAIQRNQINCFETFIEFILENKFANKIEVLDTCRFLANDFHLLIRYSFKSLKILLNELFPKVEDQSLTCSAYTTEKLPVYRLSLTEGFNMKNFNIKENKMINPPIEFRSTRFMMNLNKGSEESLMLLRNLTQNNSKKILSAPLIKALYAIKVAQSQSEFNLEFRLLNLFCFLVFFQVGNYFNIGLYFDFFLNFIVLFRCFKFNYLREWVMFGLFFYCCFQMISLTFLLGGYLIIVFNELLRNEEYRVLGMCIKKVSDRLFPSFAILGVSKMILFRSEGYILFNYKLDVLQYDEISYISIIIFFISLIIELLIVGTDKNIREGVWVEGFQKSLHLILKIEEKMVSDINLKSKFFIESCSHPTENIESKIRKLKKNEERLVKLLESNKESINSEMTKLRSKLELLINK